LVAVLLLLSLFSKEAGVLFAAVIVFYAFFFQRKNALTTIVSSLGVVLIYGYFRFFIGHILYYPQISYSHITELSFLQRIITIPAVIFYYIKTAFLPIHPAVNQEWIVASINSPVFVKSVIGDALSCFLSIALGVYVYKGYKLYFKSYLFFTFWLWIGLLFYSQLFFVLDFTVSDNWFYFPLVGFIGILGALAQIYSTKNKIAVPVLCIIAFIVIGVLSVRTIVRNANFHDNETLLTHDITYSPESGPLVFGLGEIYLYQGNFQQARPYLVKAAQLNPEISINWYTLGLLYEQTGKASLAQKAFQTAVKINDSYVSYDNYALFLYLQGKPDSALQLTSAGLQDYPSDGNLWMIKSLIDYKKGDDASAVASAKYALGYSPSKLTLTLFMLISRHQQFHIYSVWTNQGDIIVVRQS
jgi:tetratricopeptide (TPR) repeat protein